MFTPKYCSYYRYFHYKHNNDVCSTSCRGWFHSFSHSGWSQENLVVCHLVLIPLYYWIQTTPSGMFISCHVKVNISAWIMSAANTVTKSVFIKMKCGMHSQTCLSNAWYLSWLQWEFCAGRRWCFMQHSCIVTECLYSFLLCHCVGLGFESQFLWSLDCMWGTHVGCQGPLVHALFPAIGRIVCKSYGRGDKAQYLWCVHVSNLQIHMSFLISASRFGSVEGGTGRGDGWRKGGSSVKSLMHGLIGASSLMLFAFFLLLLLLSLFQSLALRLNWNEPYHRWLIWNTSHSLKLK